MFNLQYSLKTLLIAFTLFIVCIAILRNRAQRQWNAVQQIDALGGEAYFSMGTRGNGFSSTSASTQSYLPHLYRSICHVTIYPTNRNPTLNQISVLTKIPHLTSLSIWPDKSTNSEYLNLRSPNAVTDGEMEAIADAFPDLHHFHAAPVDCGLEKGNWLKNELPNLESGSIIWHLDVDERGRHYQFTK